MNWAKFTLSIFGNFFTITAVLIDMEGKRDGNTLGLLLAGLVFLALRDATPPTKGN